MTFKEANKLALEGDDDAFDIKTADHLCWNCTRNKTCYACLRYCGEIVSCNFFNVKSEASTEEINGN